VRAAAPPQLCSEASSPRVRELVFEIIGPDDAVDAKLQAVSGREVVTFEWLPQTGELRYRTGAPTVLFRDLVAASPISDRRGPMCE
jgi:hypothetical protein